MPYIDHQSKTPRSHNKNALAMSLPTLGYVWKGGEDGNRANHIHREKDERRQAHTLMGKGENQRIDRRQTKQEK
jgi:hypothetical protein